MLVTAISEFIRQNQQDIARRASARYFDRHPEIKDLNSVVEHTLEDTTFTLDFLASSIQVQSIEAFTDYVRWLRTVLETRNLDVAMIPESLADICEILREFPDAFSGAVPYLEAAQAVLFQKIDPDCRLDDRQSAYLQAVLRADRRAALSLVEHYLLTTEPASVYANLVMPAMYDVGRLWQTNRITVAREHMATATTQYVLAHVYAQNSPVVHSRGKIVVSGMQGEFHQVGAQMVADILDFDGWDVQFLGTNMPHEGILDAIEAHEATIVGLSATMLFSAPKLGALVDDIKQRFPSTRVLVGGPLVVNQFIDPISMGADAGAASLLQGRELVRNWGES